MDLRICLNIMQGNTLLSQVSELFLDLPLGMWSVANRRHPFCEGPSCPNPGPPAFQPC